jgi:hypothetical protein
MLKMNEPKELAMLNRVVSQLAEIENIDEIKTIRDKAEAVRLYLKKQGAELELQNRAAAVKIQTERRLGELLEGMEKRTGGDAARARLHDATECPPRLADLGIEKTQSHRYQLVASIPENILNGFIEKTQADGKELTTASVLRLAKEPKPEPEWNLREAIDKVYAWAVRTLEEWPHEERIAFANVLDGIALEVRTHGEIAA